MVIGGVEKRLNSGQPQGVLKAMIKIIRGKETDKVW